jgi:hypothetical protein
MSVRISSLLLFLTLLTPGSHRLSAREPKSTPVKITHYLAGDYKVTSRFLDIGATNYELRLTNIVKKSMTSMTKLFGGMPRNLSGCEDPNITLDFDTKSFHGEADPGWVEMGLDDGTWFGFITIENGLIHELFHLWNSETFRYAHRREQWFSEGCTEYYAIRWPFRQG